MYFCVCHLKCCKLFTISDIVVSELFKVSVRVREKNERNKNWINNDDNSK